MESKGLPMTRENGTRALIAVLIYSMTSGVLFGAGLILVLTLPVLSADTGLWISVVVGASFVLAAPVAWWIAPRLRARYWREQRRKSCAPL
jgi:membrane protein YdbS with pleckstrin-like domain